MNPSNNRLSVEQPLRLAHPACYQQLLEQFANYHIHPYDVKASSITQDDSIVIILRYGEGLIQSKQQSFTNDALVHASTQLIEFYVEVAELCKKTLIADYFKMIKP